MRTNLSVFWLSLLLAACVTGVGSSEAPEEPQPMSLGEPMQLKIGDTARMDEPVAMTIRFVDVPTDSRCPKGVTCVWEGDAEAVFEVRKGEESVEVGLHTHGGDQYPSHRTVAGYTLHLEALDPYPVEGRPLERSDYEATLKVTEEEEGTSGPVV